MMSFKNYLKESVFNPLKHNDLTKNPARIEVFLQKIKDGEPFMTTKGMFVVDKKHYDDLKTAMPGKGLRTILSGKLDNKIARLTYPGDFLKTAEFGGKGKGSGVAAEDAELRSFTNKLNDILAKEGGAIKLDIGGRTVECAGIISTPNPGGRDPKSDFSIVNSKGDQVAWISHKAGTKASSFQQYGGLSDKVFSTNKEVKKFMEDVKKIVGDEGMKSGQSFKRKCKNKDVICKSVYGTQFTGAKGNRGINNVDEFHLGTMKLAKKGRKYTITSLHKGLNGDIPDGDFACIYFIRYNRRRGTAAGVTVENSRVGIFAAAKAVSTTKEI